MSSVISSNSINQILGLIHGAAAHTTPEHPTITEDWCVRLATDHALTNLHDDADLTDAQRKAALEAAQLNAIRIAIAQAMEIALGAYEIVKQRFPYDDIYYPAAKETFYAALVLMLDDRLPKQFRADTQRMKQDAKNGGASC